MGEEKKAYPLPILHRGRIGLLMHSFPQFLFSVSILYAVGEHLLCRDRDQIQPCHVLALSTDKLLTLSEPQFLHL